jgi:hypothetical protein
MSFVKAGGKKFDGCFAAGRYNPLNLWDTHYLRELDDSA